MKRRTLLLTPMMAAGLALAASAPPAAAQSDVRKVVWHVDFPDPTRFSAMLTSINNMSDTWEKELIEYDIRIVFNGHGIRFLTDDKLTGTPFVEDAALAARRENLRGRMLSLNRVREVGLELCEITRVAVNRPRKSFYEEVEYVPSGVVRAAELQSEGFAYLKSQ